MSYNNGSPPHLIGSAYAHHNQEDDQPGLNTAFQQHHIMAAPQPQMEPASTDQYQPGAPGNLGQGYGQGYLVRNSYTLPVGPLQNAQYSYIPPQNSYAPYHQQLPQMTMQQPGLYGTHMNQTMALYPGPGVYNTSYFGRTSVPKPPMINFATNETPPGFNVNDIPPFQDLTVTVGPVNHGVLTIANIPYSVTKAEIMQFLGPQSAYVQTLPFHIIMERSTAKTMDAYIELETHYDCDAAKHRFENLISTGKHPKIGSRFASLAVSNQDELLKALFPRAKSLIWVCGIPIMIENTDPYSTGYNGFFTSEEMYGLTRHAENPTRSPFAKNCLQRTYECMISTLHKMPWFATDLYTLGHRNLLFRTYMSQLRVLMERIRSRSHEMGISHSLLTDFIGAGLDCAGLGERQKAEIVFWSQCWGPEIKLSRAAPAWPFDVLGMRRPGPNGGAISEQVLHFYLQLIECGARSLIANHVPSNKSPTPFSLPDYFFAYDPQPIMRGDFNGLPIIANTHFDWTEAAENLSFRMIMDMEITLMKRLLKAGWQSWQETHIGQAVQEIRTEPEGRQGALPERSYLLSLKYGSKFQEQNIPELPFGGDPLPARRALVGMPTQQIYGDTSVLVPHPHCQNSPTQSPRGTVGPELSVNSSALRMSAPQFVPNRSEHSAGYSRVPLIDPSAFTVLPPLALNSTYVAGHLGSGTFSNIATLAQQRPFGADNLNREAQIVDGDENDEGFGSAQLTTYDPDTPTAVYSVPTRPGRPEQVSVTPRLSSAVPVTRIDGAAAVLDFNRLSIQDDSEDDATLAAAHRTLSERLADVTPTRTFNLEPSPPRGPRSMLRPGPNARYNTGPQQGFGAIGTSPIGTSPQKAHARRILNVDHIIPEESDEDYDFVSDRKATVESSSSEENYLNQID